MIAWIKDLVGAGDRKVSLETTPDHVELTDKHLVIGLKLDWQNHTEESIPIKEITVRIYLNGKGEEPLQFYPLERFERDPSQRGLQKKPVKAFALPAQEIHTQQMRFISQEVLDIPAGKYMVDVEIKDISDKVYASRTKIVLENSIKYRRSEEWEG